MTQKTQTLKGFRDFLPSDMKVQNYIFDTWKRVCLRYGFEEYNAPPLEYASIYQKSGDELGTTGKELYRFNDSGGREIALRPEMTPSVARMISQYGSELPKPVKWFSIGQFFRAEKPQRGRGREFFQLNADVFGTSSVVADFEILSMAIDIVLEFGAKTEMFIVKFNNRKFSNFYFDKILGINDDLIKSQLLKIIDASPKKDSKWLETNISELTQDENIFEKVTTYLNLKLEDLVKFQSESEGTAELIELFDLLKASGKSRYCTFDTSMARGFDYYTGMVFEVFDLNPDNNRSMFGGGRYDDLMGIFGSKVMPAVGFAPGDITTKLFLESWDLLPKTESSESKVLVTIFSPDLLQKSLEVTSKLRGAKINTELYCDPNVDVSRQLKYADKKNTPYVVIVGPDEVQNDEVVLKNMRSNTQETLPLDKLIDKLSK